MAQTPCEIDPQKQTEASISTLQPETRKSSSSELYTVFTTWQRRNIIVLVAISMLTSPLAATMYLPLLPLLGQHFNVSGQAINLTITLYIVFQALAPLLLAGISDYLGRRPIYVSTLTVYSMASLGLALNNSSYTVLLILRAIQSLGASTILSVSYGTVADLSVPAERGRFLGPLLAVANLGTCIGPVFGGWIAQDSGSFRAAFWALAGLGLVTVTSMLLLLPETARHVVGNGSIIDARWNQPLCRIFKHRFNYQSKTEVEQYKPPIGAEAILKGPMPHNRPNTKHKFVFKSPLSSLRIAFYADTSIILWISSSLYAEWYCIQASMPATFKSIYRFSTLHLGLAYLPGAVGVIISMYVTGKAMDRNYKLVAKKHNFAISCHSASGDLERGFPMVLARTRGCSAFLALNAAALVLYGWSIHYHWHPAVPLILQGVLGFVTTWITQAFSALLVDLFPDTPSTASTASNVLKCALSAAAVAMIEPLTSTIGRGWFFTLLGCVCVSTGLTGLFVLRLRGLAWQKLRMARREDTDIAEVSVAATVSTIGETGEMTELRDGGSGVGAPGIMVKAAQVRG